MKTLNRGFLATLVLPVLLIPIRIEAHDTKVAGLSPLEWSVCMADSEINRRGDKLAWRPGRNVEWDYTAGLFTWSLLKLNEQLPTPEYVEFSKDTVGSFISPEGSIRGYKAEDYNLDDVAPGKTVIALYQLTKEERYRKCAELLRKQLQTHPRTSQGGFWHEQRYPNQMWLDGLFMGPPFYAEYVKVFKGPATDYDDVVKQFRLIGEHLYDAKTGLYYHGWDESRKHDWANPTSGTSSNFWGRGLGWYAMACVDVLDFLPKDHPGRNEILTQFKQVAAGIVKWQDPKSGLWWQVMDQGGREGNYLEATASAMFVYALAKGLNEGYLAHAEFEPVADRGYLGIIQRLIKRDERGDISLTQCCSVAGLGHGRDGSYAYYLREPVIYNDLKGVAPFILAGLELQNLHKLPMKVETRTTRPVWPAKP
ncbi:MAG: glycoside hydrolase family 88 protein [Verrucomicrobiota bacterium]